MHYFRISGLNKTFIKNRMVDISKADKLMDKIAEKATTACKEGVKDGLLTSFKQVVKLTPVAELGQPHPGHLRNNWQVSTGALIPTQIEYTGSVVAVNTVISRLKGELSTFDYGREAYFYNAAKNVPGKESKKKPKPVGGGPVYEYYAWAVEYAKASPSKAPQGMMRIGMINSDVDIYKHVVKRMKKEFS